ncbi:glutamate 5-kinase [Deltaproteobacteria bacterium TL4]
MTKTRIVIKVGTNVLQRPNGKLDYNVISELGDQLAAIHEKGFQVVLVSSGAVGAGKELVHFEKEKRSLLRKQMTAAVGQVRLMQIYSDFFLEHRILIAQILLTRADFGNRVSYLNVRNTLEGLLSAQVLPIINENDVVATEELESKFGDNDLLAVYVAALIGADRLFFLTTARGFLKLDENGGGETLIPVVETYHEDLLQLCHSNLSKGGTGGMLSKVKAAGMAMSFGIHAHILYGKEQNAVLRVLENEKIGTHFLASGKKIKNYQKWLAAGALSKGKIVIDPGAEQALRNKKSLLAKGIVTVEGHFEVKDLVGLFNQTGEKIGVGQVRLSEKELKQQLQVMRDLEKSNSSENKNEHSFVKVVIHCDHLFLQ